MDLLIVIVLGVVQGIIEFFPVSSSGHMVLLERLIGFHVRALPLHLFLHIGTSLAVVFTLRRDVFRLVIECGRMIGDLFGNLKIFAQGVRRGEDPAYTKIVRTNYRKLVMLLLAASLPMAVIGVLLVKTAEVMSQSLMYTGAGFLLTAILLLVSSMIRPGDELPRDIPYWKMCLIGCLQSISVLPGVSRFAVTLSGGILSGMSRQSAVRISLLLLLPASFGSLIAEYTLPVMPGIPVGRALLMCIVGGAAAFAAGMFAIRHVLRFVRVRKLNGFSYYCFAVGIVSVILSFVL